MPEPIINLLNYQKKAFVDRHQYKIYLWARGTRKTSTVCNEIVDHCYWEYSKGRSENWLIVSRTEKQSLEAMREVLKYAKVYKITTSNIAGFDCWNPREGRSVKA